jgi:hypothetical protein
MSIWPVNLFYRVGRWLTPSELHALGDVQVSDLARDIGVSAGELYRLEAEGPESLYLLFARLAQQGIDLSQLQSKYPSVFKDLQRVCSACRDKQVCQRDLATGAQDDEWRTYCPNVVTLDALNAAGDQALVAGAHHSS